MMDSIPDDLVVSACSDTTPDSEDQPSIERFLQQLKDLIAFFVVRQVGCSVCAWEGDVSSLACVHAVVDHDRTNVRKAIAVHKFVDDVVHLARGLVSSHFPEDRRADRAANPILLALQTVKARFV